MQTKKIFIFGNGNTSFQNFILYYVNILEKLVENPAEISFLVCDFRGIDTLVMEFLKTKTPHVTLLHIGEKPRYLPDNYLTFVKYWQLIGNFKNDQTRDNFAIENCTHFLAMDFNSNENRKSGTQKNIEKCLKNQKIDCAYIPEIFE